MTASQQRHAHGSMVRAERRARGWDRPEMARRLGQALTGTRPDFDSLLSYVKRWEAGKVGISERYRLAYAKAFQLAEEGLFGGRDGASSPHVAPLEDDNEVKRRRLLECLGALGVSGAVRTGSLEPIRTALGQTLPGHDHDAADWEEIAFEYGHAFLTRAPAVLLPDLAADVVALHDALGRATDDKTRHRLCSAGGKLAALVAMAMAAMGDRRQARDWWATARHTADSSTDRDLRVWVRGYEAMSSLYADRPVALVLRRADEAIAIAGGDVSCTAVLEAMAVKAQALAMLGDGRSAETLVTDIERRFDAVAPAPAEDRLSTRAWPETALRHTQAFVFTHTAKTAAATRAQDAAMALYPTGMTRQRAKIELLRATCLVRGGDVVGGLQHAHTVVHPLAGDQRTATISRGARMVVDAVPSQDRTLPKVIEYRELLALNPGD